MGKKNRGNDMRKGEIGKRINGTKKEKGREKRKISGKKCIKRGNKSEEKRGGGNLNKGKRRGKIG